MPLSNLVTIPILTTLLLASMLCVNQANAAPKLETLLSFDDANGAHPAAAVTIDASGNIFGTARFGGLNFAATGGDGTVFELPHGHYRRAKRLFAFSGTNGQYPSSALVVSPSGALFGTTTFGGGASGAGTVFELFKGRFQSLASFGGSVGANPTSLTAFPARQGAANFSLFGTTIQGGSNSNGTVFRLSGPKPVNLTVTTSFGGQFAEQENAALVAGPNGVLYGLNATAGQNGQGVIFRLSGPAYATIDVLATFTSIYEGAPAGGLTVDAKGDLYGNIAGGGDGTGIVFELKGPNYNQLVTLASGSEPVGAPLVDAAGNVYGTTSVGGTDNQGTVFRISADHATYTVLHSFTGADGANPFTGLTSDSQGNLFGTTSNGGAGNYGTVFMLSGSGFVLPGSVQSSRQ